MSQRVINCYYCLLKVIRWAFSFDEYLTVYARELFMQPERDVIYFGAGPAKLPNKVLISVQAELLDYSHTGMSVLEMSHRSSEFSSILRSAEAHLRELLKIPPDYDVLFMHSGATSQFSAVAMNLLGRQNRTDSANEQCSADYIITGLWSSTAALEAAKFSHVRKITPTGISNFNEADWQLDPQADYLYYCDNETVDGVEFPRPPIPPPGVPLVCDMSSNFMTRPIDVTKFGLIFAGAQQNIGCAGVTVVVLRHDLAMRTNHHCQFVTNIPVTMDYRVQVEHNSLYNTPPTFGIYIVDLVMKWTKCKGGVVEMQQRMDVKSDMLYQTIDSSRGFYTCPVNREHRSRVNIIFRIGGGDEHLEKTFVECAEKDGLKQLQGHSSVGGLRVSLYNAIKVRHVAQLVAFMGTFQRECHMSG